MSDAQAKDPSKNLNKLKRSGESPSPFLLPSAISKSLFYENK